MARSSDRAVLLIVVTLLAVVSICQTSMYNPCQPLTAIARGEAFPLGLALVPSINASYLANLTVTSGGMCNTTLQDLLVSRYNASLAIYNTRMDRLQVLRMPFPDIIFNMVNASPPIMALVAFRANVTSQPIYIASGYTDETFGAGFVISTALLLRFDLGQLQYLQWYDMTCNECGGVRSALCIHSTNASVRACATPLDNCSCANSNSTNCTLALEEFDGCSTAINAAWLGTDRNSAVMRTGPQVQRLNAYSITSLFNTARDKFTNLKDFVYTNVVASWGSVSSGAQSEFVDFEGGLSQYAKSLPPSPPSPPPAPPPAPPAPPPSPSPPPAPPPTPTHPPVTTPTPPPTPPPQTPPPPTPPPPTPTPSTPPASTRRLAQEGAAGDGISLTETGSVESEAEADSQPLDITKAQ